MATRDFKNEQQAVTLGSGVTTLDVFTVPGGETWLVQRLSRRLTAKTGSPANVEIHREVVSTTEDEIVEDLGDNPALETQDAHIDFMQGKVLKAGDKIVVKKDTGAVSITLNFHIDYLRDVP